MPLPNSLPIAGPADRPALAAALGRFLRSPWSLVLAVAIAFLLNSASLPLSDVDEGAFSEATREMLERGNLVSPTLDGNPRHDKPILTYWAQAAAVSALGPSELAFRLPSLIAAVLWLIAIYRFCLRHGDREQAQAAALVMALSLMVGLVAKAAIADALLNLFLCLALFGVYDYFCAVRNGRPPAEIRRILLSAYAALGFGFLTKGPVALLVPLLAGSLFLAAAGAWRAWLRALLHPPGWLLFLAIAAPWHLLVWLDQGDAFFRGFYLQHNLQRYTSTFEQHGGSPLYYVAVLPVVLLPFTGWLLAVGRRLLRAKTAGPGASPGLERFLLIWFAVVFVFFSLSRTQLPHYILYGCTPLFILLSRHRPVRERRLPAFLPALLFALVLALLPAVLDAAAEGLQKPYEKGLAQALAAQFDAGYAVPAGAAFLAMLGLALWRRLPVWEGLVFAGLLQALIFSGLLLPRVLAATQAPVREAAFFARQSGEPVVAWRLNRPSFSVYRRAPTPARLPQAGELALTRSDRVGELQQAVAPDRLETVFSRGYVVLLRVLPREAR